MIRHESLKKFTREVFLRIGCTEAHANLASEVLVSADLRGIESHGVARLSGYVRLWDINRINSQPEIRVTHETPSTAVVDGDLGLGLVVGPAAMSKAIEKADAVGSGWVGVKNSNHFGIAGYHAMMALDHDMIGITMTNASPLVAPTFSVERLLGTNPIAVAIPAQDEPPFVADFATTTAANGKLEVLMRKDKPAPMGWIQDKDGNNTNNASGVKEGGALLPLGGTRIQGSHKGYALGAIVDIFSGVLSGANFGPWVPPFVSYAATQGESVGQGLGHFFGALRVDAFRPKQEFKFEMDRWIKRFRSSKVVHGAEKVIIPGDPERAMEENNKQNGIELTPSVVEDLEALAQRFEISSIF